MCVTQISAELSVLSAPLNSSRLFSNVRYGNKEIYTCGEMKSFSVPLCLSLLSSLCSALPPSLLQLRFIIWKADVFAPQPCLSSRLHSAENCFNLHLSAANPVSSVCLSAHCAPPPAPNLTKTIQTATLPLSGFTLLSARRWRSHSVLQGAELMEVLLSDNATPEQSLGSDHHISTVRASQCVTAHVGRLTSNGEHLANS